MEKEEYKRVLRLHLRVGEECVIGGNRITVKMSRFKKRCYRVIINSGIVLHFSKYQILGQPGYGRVIIVLKTVFNKDIASICVENPRIMEV